MSEDRSTSILRASVVSAIGTGLSRVLGALREIAIGHVFGAGRSSDVFWIAFTVPSVFRHFVADEGLTGALVPAVAKAEREEGEQAGRRFAGASLAALLIACVLLCAAGMLAARPLVMAFASGFADDPAKFELTVTLTRWLFPFVLFVSLVSWCEGLLNHRGHFFVPKIAPGVLSACLAASALWLVDEFDEPLFALVVGALVGAAVHLLVCIPPLVKRWGALWPRFCEMQGPRFRTFLREMGKVVLIGLLAQINVMVLRQLASLLAEGSVTHYWYASRIVDLAHGAIGIGVASALLPVISRAAADHSWDLFRESYAEAVRLAALLLFPAASLLVGLALPVTAILFQHGRFERADAQATASVLVMLVPFMLALAGVNITKKAYFALDDRNTLLAVGSLGVALTAGLGYLLSASMGVEGLGIALSVSTLVQLVCYLLLLRRRVGSGLGLGALVGPLLRMIAAGAPAGVAAWAIALLGDWPAGSASLRNWLVLAAAGLGGIAAFVLSAWLLRVPELQRVIARIRARFGRSA